MFKKFFTYPVFLVLFLSFVGTIGFGSLLTHHYLGGERFQSLQNIAVTISEIPMSVRDMIKYKTLNLNKLRPLLKHKDKKRFEKFIENKRNALLVLPRYEHSLSRSVVDIIDLNNFEIIHTYKHDIAEMNNQVTNTKEFPRLKIDRSPVRFLYTHPLLFEDGSLIGSGIFGPLFKLGFCSNIQWINEEEIFHHSKMLNHEGNILLSGQMNPKSQYVKRYSIKNFSDDSIIKISTDGEILFNKSLTEVLIENEIIFENYALNKSLSGETDPLHVNDIEPALNNTEHWMQGDMFISVRYLSAIIHYRPSTNKVINYIIGPFAQQHDVDIISDKEISIFNNNNFIINNEHSEVLVYNFETKTFKKMFNHQLQKENFKTYAQGLSHTFKDGSLLVEEQNHGRIILFNNRGEKELEFVNKDKNGNIGFVSWSRVIEDELIIKNFKLLVKNKQCLN
jgi:hypothetical protein